MWAIRIILHHMRIGIGEKTLFEAWHPDAQSLFDNSASLRRVCWELWDTSKKLS